MKTMSLSALRAQLFRVFFVMRDTGAEFEVSYRSKIYKLSVQDTGKRLKRHYRKSRGSRVRVNPLLLNVAQCPDCKGMMLQGVCVDNCKLLQEAR